MRILLVEDDRALSMAVAYRLKKEGFEVVAKADGRSGMAAAETESFDLLLLDRMLPGLDGVSLLSALRAGGSGVPVLLLTAMDGITDRVTGLDAGADDYLVKPFAMDELMARVRALLRRQAAFCPEGAILYGDLSFDPATLTLRCHERAAELSPREARLMEFLLRNRGQVLPRGLIIDRVWSDTFVEGGNLDIHVHFLRKHLETVRSKVLIRTVRGVGYQLTGGE